MNASAAWRVSIEPRAWQLAAMRVWLESQRGIVSVVTGAGKTLFAQLCMLQFKQRFPNGKYVILLPTVALLDQWYVSLQEDLHVPLKDIATYSGEGNPDRPSVVNLMVLNTGREKAPDIARHFETFLIVDECHRAASRVNSLALGGPHKATLGLSATPERQYDTGLDDVLVPALGEVILRYDYNEALRDGVISPFELINVAVDLQRSERTEYDDLTRRIGAMVGRLRKGEPVEETVKRLLRNRAAVASRAKMRVPTAVKLVERHRTARTLIFHERIDAAEQLRELLVARRISVTVYHSKIDPVVRRDNLRLFRRGVFSVLVSCRALDEGTNVPETTVAIIASSTASTRQRIQRLGRVLRPAPGKSHATIYTIYATQIEEERLAREALSLTEADSISWKKAALNADA